MKANQKALNLANDDRALAQLGVVVGGILAATIGLLVFASLQTATSKSLNDTKKAYPESSFPGVAALVNVIPLLLIVGALGIAAFVGYQKFAK